MYWVLLVQVAPIVALLVLGFSIGTIVERRHLRRLDRRELALSDLLVTASRAPDSRGCEALGMVVGEVVIGSDYFKTFAAKLRMIVGGELRSFESLMVRARREAVVRMLESAKALGANSVVNVRFATSNIGSMRAKRPAAMVEMYAYGTAIRQ